MRANSLGLSILIALTNCVLPGTSPLWRSDGRNQEISMATQSALPPVEIKFISQRSQRPPLVSLFFDITLRNDQSEPRWFILPSKLNLPPGKGVDGVEVFHLGGKGRVIIGRFQGTGGFQILLLPPKAEVTLRGLPISFWGIPPKDSLSVDVIIADRLTIGNEPAEAWFSSDPTSDVRADVTFAQSERVTSKFTPDRHEVQVLMAGDLRMKLQVKLTSD
ncbi:hypothetical protein Cylst_0668 [Cylindrospermum stagnale PCC 7417]|uniref:Uncharacterized protein n=1 Tax=Cylindrospermum stagnale PCC 7417 TaxID=56107 RepID=K9WTY1_9NOST|nr:hypothetical protein [Cylindrospermum stagnale]AFZ22993.1 hypothetical protein Cylst_0664 [Cylindrospermum stagnale PCC 7417]AFZ22997.1 hypothetical protein Cylst_0668 [Cylindrospermum stagnale PCC 7417]